jgi:hypothetical protein
MVCKKPKIPDAGYSWPVAAVGPKNSVAWVKNSGRIFAARIVAEAAKNIGLID